MKRLLRQNAYASPGFTHPVKKLSHLLSTAYSFQFLIPFLKKIFVKRLCNISAIAA
jgi:hypothetical protein